MSLRVGNELERHQRVAAIALFLSAVIGWDAPLRAEHGEGLIRAVPRVRLNTQQQTAKPLSLQGLTRTVSAGAGEFGANQVLPLNVSPPGAPAVSPNDAAQWGLVGAGDSQPLMVLDGREIACRAVRRWLPSELLRMRACTILRLHGDEKDEDKRCAAVALAQFLRIQARHQEDIGAASALRAYYTRIALAEKLALTLDSLQMINSEQAKHAALQAQGMSAVVDSTSFERLRIEVNDSQLLIATQDRRLRCLLAELTGVDYEASSIYQERLEVYRNSLDCARLKARALSERKDLQSWIYLSRRVNESSAPMFAKMLPTLIGGYSLPIPPILGIQEKFCPPDYSQLASDMCREIQITIETHRRWINQAVEEKVANVLLGYDRIELAQQKLASWQSRIAQLEVLEKQGAARPEDRAEADAAVLKVRAEEIDRRLDARIAEIDLSEAVGGISERCCAGLAWFVTGTE